MESYLGVVVGQSLHEPQAMEHFRILATRQGQSWRIHLIEAGADELSRQIRYVQQNMAEGNWYAHFFRDDELLVVFRDAVFHMGVNPRTWGAVLDSGRKRGIPPEQLDFSPRTPAQAQEYFGLQAPPAV